MFKKKLKEIAPQTGAWRLNPGQSVQLSKEGLQNAMPLSFVQPIGDQDLDYEFEFDLIPPKTEEVAKNLSALSIEQKNIVIRYCQELIPRRYQELGGSSESYFAKVRTWRLSLFDHEGQSLHFYYRVTCERIDYLPEAPASVAWSTELPLAKLYSAIATGESLSSLYVRVNDEIFAEDIEKELEGVDLLEDPLLLCLFYDCFGSYQKAQLDRIIQSR